MANFLLWGFVFVACVALVGIYFPKQSAQFKTTISGKCRFVVDGDSLYIKGHKPQIRLWGVDAPEANERGFDDAKSHLNRLAMGLRLRCLVIDTDHYGRTIARCFLPDGQEVNAEMISSGFAREYRRFSKGFYSREGATITNEN